MSIQSNELVWRKSLEVSDSGTNGGAMSSVASTTSIKNNIFPDIPESERAAGGTKYRKLFILVNNSEDPDLDGNEGLALIAPKVFVETQTLGDDMINIFPGTFSDVQGGISTPQKYGMGTLNAPVAGGNTVSSIVVNVEDWTNAPIFVAGMTIRVSDKTSIADAVNNEEYHVVAAGGVAVSGNQITLTLESTLTFGYAAGTKVSSVYEPGDISATVHTPNNGGSGTFNDTLITTDNTGTISDTWTVTFTSASAFNVSGAATGSVGSGNVGSDFTATNPSTSGRFFTILSTVWGGTFVTNDVVSFVTDPAAIPLWYERIVPAGASSVSGNSVVVAVDGESS